jgi:integrase
MFSDAVKAGLLSKDDNALAKVTLPRPTGRIDIKPPTLEEVMALSKVARAVLGDYGLPYACFIEFAVGSLMRPGELFELQWPDIHLDECYIKVSRNLRRDGTVGDRKTHRPAIIALLPMARRALARLPRRLTRRTSSTPCRASS